MPLSRPKLNQDLYKGCPCEVCGDKCPGFFMHAFRKRCANCGCDPYKHTGYGADLHSLNDTNDLLIFEAPDPKELARQRREMERKQKLADKLATLTWIPKKDTTVELEDLLAFVNGLPKDAQPWPDNMMHDEKANYQYPIYDMKLEECSAINTDDPGSKARFDAQEALRVKDRCYPILRKGPRGLEVFVPELNKVFPPTGPECKMCGEFIIDHMVFKGPDGSGDTYCQRHWVAKGLEQKIPNFRPRCAACDELCFNAQITQIQEDPSHAPTAFHVAHFCCDVCDTSLGGKPYIRSEETGMPICVPCFNSNAPKCPGCGKALTDGEFYEGVGPNGDESWCVDCYKCKKCGGTYEGMVIDPEDGYLYCPNCIKNHPKQSFNPNLPPAMKADLDRIKKAQGK